MADATDTEKPPILQYRRERLLAGENIARRPEVQRGPLAMWSSGIRYQLEKIYGRDSPLLHHLPPRGIDRSIADSRSALIQRMEIVSRIIKALEMVPRVAANRALGDRIFIGHGRSHVWLQLKDFIRENLGLPCDEFNVEPAAGMSTTERLQAMLDQAGFAFVVMTAEEQHTDGRVYARPNVIHESGLFQGKLGIRRAIILLEEGCSDFSNIAGLTQIRFPKDDMRASFEQVRGVLKREGMI